MNRDRLPDSLMLNDSVRRVPTFVGIHPPLHKKGGQTPCHSGLAWTQNAMGGGQTPFFVQRRIHPRHGFTIVELIATCVVLGIMFSITIPMFLVIARERRSTEQRQFAVQHATNLLEQASSRDWTELTPGELTVPDASTDLQTILPGLERTMMVKHIESEQPSRQIIASVRWRNHTGQWVSPLQLSAWVFPTNEVP